MVVPGSSDHMGDKYIGILRDSFLSMEMAQNILVVKTVAGMAMAAAAALDALHWQEIVGCIAGDDTIMLVVHEAASHDEVRSFLSQIIPNIK